MKLNLPRLAVTVALAATCLGATGCIVDPIGPPVAVGVGVYPGGGYGRPYYGGRGYYGRPAYYGPRGGGYYGRRW